MVSSLERLRVARLRVGHFGVLCYEYSGTSIIAMIVLAVLLHRTTNDVLAAQMPMLRLLAGDACVAYDYWKHVGEFSIGLLTALGGALTVERAVGNLGIIAGAGLMVLGSCDFAHCGIH